MSETPPTPDAFSTVNALIKLAVDPAACRARLAKLQKLLEQSAAAEQRLAERSAAFDQKVATEKAALDERKAALDARALQLYRQKASSMEQRTRTEHSLQVRAIPTPNPPVLWP